MFCAKCGNQIRASDYCCPKCGARNLNYQGGETPGEKQPGGGKSTGKKWVILAASLAVLAAAGVTGFLALKGKRNSYEVNFTPSGIQAYLTVEGDAVFLEGAAPVIVPGPASRGKTSPDHTKKIVLMEDGALLLSETVAKDGEQPEQTTRIAEHAEEIRRVSNQACYYTSGEDQTLFVYEFDSGETADTGIADSRQWYSAGMESVAALSDDGRLSIFTRKDRTLRDVCSMANVEHCCVTDDGEDMFWSVEEENSYLIYKIINGAPERIGEIRKSGKYSYVYGFFFDGGQSFVAASPGSNDLLLYTDGEPRQITFPGVCQQSMLMDENWRYVDSEDDRPEAFYIPVKKNKDAETADIYRLNMDGELECVCSDVQMSGVPTLYSFRNGYGFFCDSENDFYVKKLHSEDAPRRITTEVDDFSISASGKYVFLEKAGSLYYWDVESGDLKINLITTGYTEDASIFLTDQDEKIYYLTDRKDLDGTYRQKGTLFRCTVGEEPEEISGEILGMLNSGGEFYSSSAPLIMKYISNEGYDCIVEIGTEENGTYRMLVSNVEY